MIESMTGFGSSLKETEEYKIQIEIRTINSRSLDISLKTPSEFIEYETEIRNIISIFLERGKIHFNIFYTSKGPIGTHVKIDEELFKYYYSNIKSIATSLNETHTPVFAEIIKLPNVIKFIESEHKKKIPKEEFFILCKQALQECKEHRIKEGSSINEKINQSLQKIDDALENVEKLDGMRLQDIRQKITQKITQVIPSEKINQDRLEQEMIYYLEKLDITEEKSRLSQHIHFFKEVQGQNTSQGKKLSFISQEIGREINTMSSKANDYKIQHSVVEMKDEVEKIKEQLLNII
ncbi:MAG: YicC/YloC family endoribonuclease [Chitinophagaceae bacterium]|nr:YicC/YloC family endoribonuclease [Chitinophagaceae bacterium]